MRVALRMRANEGYNAEQAAEKGTITVGELRELLEGLEDDTEIVTLDLNNGRGARWGTIDRWEAIAEFQDDEE